LSTALYYQKYRIGVGYLHIVVNVLKLMSRKLMYIRKNCVEKLTCVLVFVTQFVYSLHKAYVSLLLNSLAAQHSRLCFPQAYKLYVAGGRD